MSSAAVLAMLTRSINTELATNRKRLFSIILQRIVKLHEAQPPPASYYSGQPYVEDKRKIDCIITAPFNFPGFISSFEFWLYGARIVGKQYSGVLLINVHRRISQRLFDDIKFLRRGEQFIIGYLASAMPSINRRLLDNRYYEGHLLSRTFAIFETIGITLTSNGQVLRLHWPPSIAPFPPSAKIAPNINEIYVRDFIDAINAYFRGDFDEAVARGAIGFDAVKHLVLCHIERRPPRLDMTVYPYLPRAHVAMTSAKTYMGLLTGASS